MATPTYTALASVTLASLDTSITLSSIPTSYRDLILVMDFSINSTGGEGRIRINGDTGSNYSEIRMINANSGFSPSGGNSAAATLDYLRPGVSPAPKFWSIVQFMDSGATDKHTTVLHRTNNTDEYVAAKATRWANTAAITSLEIYASANSFNIGSTFTLFGVVS